MFDLNKNILGWKNTLKSNDSFTNENIDELEDHLIEQIENLKISGLNDEEAFWVAQKRIGSLKTFVQEYEKVNNLNIVKKKIYWMLTGIVMMLLYIFFVSSLSNGLQSLGLIYDLNLITVTYIDFLLNEILFITLASLLIWVLAVKKSNYLETFISKLNYLFDKSISSKVILFLLMISIVVFFYFTFYYRSNLNISIRQSEYYHDYKELIKFLTPTALVFHSVIMILIYFISYRSNKKLNLTS
jgi:hypothetical protein